MEGDSDIFTKFFTALKESVAEICLIPAHRKELHLQRWLVNFCALKPTFSMAVTEFLGKIFSDRRCWCDGGLVGRILGEFLISDRPDNPLNFRIRYHMACRYCLEEQIPRLFVCCLHDYVNKWICSGKPQDAGRELMVEFEGSSPIESYWTSLINGHELKPYNPEFGFRRALKINWPEGVEYFYQRCDSYLKDKLLAKCWNADFCLRTMDEHYLHRNFLKNATQRRSFCKLLINNKQLDTFIHIFDHIEPKTVSQDEYIQYMSLLCKNLPAFADDHWAALEHLWNHHAYQNHRTSDDLRMCRPLVHLILSFEKDDKNDWKEKTILDMMKTIDDRDEIKNQFIHKIAVTRGITKDCFIRCIHNLERFFKIAYSS